MLSSTTWLYAAGGILFLSGGFRLIGGNSSFPRIADEFRYMMGLTDERGALALLLVAGQLLYYR